MNTPAASFKAHPLFVLNPSKVKDSLAVLRLLKAHSTLAGYLCIQRTAAQQGRLNDLHPQFKDFFKDFLTLKDAPANRPFINPFVAADAKVWINGNVAGSYSPSSLRGVSPLLQVLTITEHLYTLNSQHWLAARQFLLSERKIPVLPLAVFLFRDRGITSENPTLAALIRAFQQEFGYLDEGVPTDAYRALYADYSLEESFEQSDWFTPYIENSPSEQE